VPIEKRLLNEAGYGKTNGNPKRKETKLKGTKYIVHLAVAMLLVAVMLPLGLVLMPAAPVFAGSTTDVSGNITAKIVFTAPSAISSWALAQGTAASNQQTSDLNVQCNTSWTATVVDSDSSNTSGKMASYNGTAYDTSNKLDNALLITSDQPSGGNTQGQKTLGTGALEICDGVVGGQGDDNAGEDVTITFNQQIEYKDSYLSSPNYYRIVVTFSATIS